MLQKNKNIQTIINLFVLLVCVCSFFSCDFPKSQEKNTIDSFPENSIIKSIHEENPYFRLSSKPIKVFVALDTECPLSKQYTQKINQLSKKYKKNTVFFAFFPGSFYSEEQVDSFMTVNNLNINFFIDYDLSITKYLRATVVPEAFVINSKWEIFYQGLIDNWASELGRTRQYTSKHYLENAIIAITKEKKPSIKKTNAIGCLIDFEKSETKISFSDDIAKIIYANCASCHYKEGPAPFSLTSYSDIHKRKKMIYHVISSNFMPPWPADPNFSHFLGEKILTKKEKKIIQKWIKDGADLSLEEKKYEPIFKSKKKEADLIVRMEKAYKIKSDNKDKFLMMKFPFELPQDTFIQSIEFVPGNNQIVHHINAHLITYDERKKNIFNGERVIDTELFSDSVGFKKLDLFNDDGSIPFFSRSVSNYLPGSVQTMYPNGIGIIHAKTKNVILVNDFHYGPSNIEASDSSYFKIYFSKTPPKRKLREITLGSLGLKEDYYSNDTIFYCVQEIFPKLIVEPNKILECSTKVKIKKDISILTINPHMHLLGKSFLAYAITEKKDTIPLIKIDNWNFRWQYFYTYKKMLKIPANSEIIVKAVFDNTLKNLDNPFDPPKLISEKIEWNGKGSMKTTDEMLQFIISYLPYQEGDEKISLEP